MPRRALPLLLLIGLSVFLAVAPARGQPRPLTYGVQVAGAAATGEALPFWLVSNRHAFFGPGATTALARVSAHAVSRPTRRFDVDFGADVVGKAAGSGSLYVHQLYLSLRYDAFRLRLGRAEETLGTYDPALSTGSFVLSRNATPPPRVSLSTPQYVPLPFTQGFIHVRGYLSHGWLLADRFVRRPYLHEKAAYLRLGGEAPLNVHAGLVHGALWAGSDHPSEGRLPQSLRDFVRVFLGRRGDEEAPRSEHGNVLGNHVGMWDFGLRLQNHHGRLLLYRHVTFDDRFGLTFQTPRDGLLGISLRRTEAPARLMGLLWEFIYTKQQTNRDVPRTLGEISNYYNNYLYRSGYTSAGRTLGNPLLFIRQPGFDPATDRTINESNRIVAHHLGADGQLPHGLAYRLLFSYSRNYGNYADAFEAEDQGLPYRYAEGLRQRSLLLEVAAPLPRHPQLTVRLAAALDAGNVRTRSRGLLLSLQWQSRR